MLSSIKDFFKQISSINKTEDGISSIIDLYKDIVDCLKPLYSGNNKNAENSILHIGVFDTCFVSAYAITIKDGTFKSKLYEKISTELGISFADIIVHTKDDNYPKDRTKIKGRQACFYAVLPITASVVSSKAQIEVLHNRGKLLKDVYVLSLTDKEQSWNIGRGKISQVGKGYIRQNHIVFDDDSTNECNKYVSRNHAHIEYSDGVGFLLYVDEGGRRSVKNRTRVIRCKEFMDLESNMIVPVQLQDGDQIELGKHAILGFKIIK